jgi:hypothetical protein
MTFMPSEGQQTTRPTPAVREAQQAKRTIGEDPAPAPGHSRAHVPADFRTIDGWGADLDPANRPAVPRELPSDVLTARGDVKHRQVPRGKVHMSNEYPDLTPVFGDTVQPRGLSGLIRDYAYNFGEATNRHWMMLLLADRIDVYESAVVDLFTGRYVKEKGWTTPHLAEMDSKTRHSYAFVGAVAVIGLAIAAGVMLTRDGRD